jgi:hypothetical protein
VNDLESLKQTNQIMQGEMTKLSQRCLTCEKEKVQLKGEIEFLLVDKQRLIV